MKTMVGFSFWNKVDMLSWLLEGVVNNFDPRSTEVVMALDVCTDGSVEAFHAMTEFWLTKRGFKWGVEIADQSGPPIREVGCHLALQKRFLQSDADLLLVAQDDQHFNQTMTELLGWISGKYGDRLGVFTGRDGYDWGYGRFAGSLWSESALQERLGHGEWRERTYMNSGPIVYSRKVVEQVGFVDTEFQAFYVWDDYGARAHKAGFVNGVMGMDITHAKFGRISNTTWYTPEISHHDITRVKTKHGLP